MGAWNKKRAMKRDNFIKTMNPLSQEDILAKFGKDTLPKADPEAVRIFTENTIALKHFKRKLPDAPFI